MYVSDALDVLFIYIVQSRLSNRMRLLRASVLCCFVDASSIKCTQNDLQTIAEIDFSKVISYPITETASNYLPNIWAWLVLAYV